MLERFTSDKFKNTHIEFTQEGMKLWVTLNIPKGLVKYLSPNNVKYVKKNYVYAICTPVEFPVTIGRIKNYYNGLMEKAMTNVRKAKQERISHEIETIKQRKILY